MNLNRIRNFKASPHMATLPEIVQLADLAEKEALRRHALFAIVTLVHPLQPTGGPGRGGAMVDVLRLARDGLADLHRGQQSGE